MRVGIIGPGGRGLAVGCLWIREGVADIVAVSDLRVDGLERAKARLCEVAPNAEYYTDNAELLARDDLDLVIVATYDPYHAEPSVEVLNAGKDLFVEKPMTQTIEDARRVVEAWRASGRLGVVGHELRHCNFIQYAKRRIAEGAIGRPIMAVTLDSCGRMGGFFRRWKTRVEERIVSLTLQKGTHHLDLQSYLMDARPKRVFATAGRSVFGGDKPNDLTCGVCDEAGICTEFSEREKKTMCCFRQEVDVEDHSMVLMDMGDVRAAYLQCHYATETVRNYVLIGTLGRAELSNNTITVTTQKANKTKARAKSLFATSTINVGAAPGGHGGADPQVCRDFVDLVLEGRIPVATPQAGRMCVAVGCAATHSLRNGNVAVDISPCPV